MGETTIQGLFWVMFAAALAPIIADVIPRVTVPVVVLELLLGILFGPHLLHIISHSEGLDAAQEFGVIFLFFIAGFEVDFAGIKGKPIGTALVSWIVSFAIAIATCLVLQQLGLTSNFYLFAIAICTTSLGSLMPILQDSGQIKTPFGVNVLSLGTVGEFAPVLLVAFALNTSRTGPLTALAIVAFLAIVAAILFVNQRAISQRDNSHIRRIAIETLDSSAQFAVRISMLVLIGLVYLTIRFDLDVLLGAFAGGFIIGQLGDVTSSSESRKIMEWMKAKFEAIGYGVLVPLFFVITGVNYQLDDLLSSTKALVLMPIMVVVFLVVRGLPVLLGYRDLEISMRTRLALITATQLPLLVTIVDRMAESGDVTVEMSTAVIGAAVISVTIFPILGFNGLDHPSGKENGNDVVEGLPEIPKEGKA